VSAQWTARKHDAYFDPDWRKLRAAGPVLTNLIHETDLLRYICGEIESVYAETSSSVRGHGKEETAAIIMRFTSGALGTFFLSDATPSPWAWEFATGENPKLPPSQRNCYRFMGSKAALEFPNLVVWRHGERSGAWHDEIRREDLSMDLGDAFEHQCRHFCGVIRGAEEPRITVRDATATLAATVAVFEAQETERPVLL
jgi:predicted dehydrogenase